MNLTELKQKPITELLELAEQMGIENMARSRKQDVIFSLLKKHAKSGEEISGDGVLEILQDGFGFLRSADASYLAGPDDIYVSPSQIRRFNLHTGDTIEGEIRIPKEGERYFALLKVNEISFEPPANAKNLVLFDNLTPIYPDRQLVMENGEKNLSNRVIDIMAPIGCGQRGMGHLGDLGQDLQVPLRGRLGHQQEDQQADRLLIRRIEADGVGELEHCRHGSRQALDAAMGNGNSVPQTGRAQAFACEQAIGDQGTRQTMQALKEQTRFLESAFLAGDINAHKHLSGGKDRS